MEQKGGLLMPREYEVVVLVSFYKRDFRLPFTHSCGGLLFYNGMEVRHLHPNIVLHMAFFITLCEAYLGMGLYFNIWRYMFYPHMFGDKMMDQ